MAILNANAFDFISNTVQQTERLGIRLGELLQPGDRLCFYGDLGTGKTALARGIGRGWGTTRRVTSPTFTLINEYPRASDGLILYHLDFYRLVTEGDIITTGIEDIIDSDGVMMIEWAERVEDFLGPDRLTVHLDHVTEFKRSMHFEASGSRSRQLLDDFRRSAFGV